MDEILTAKEVASYLKVNERTVLKYANEHKLPAVKVGGQWRFKREVLDRWLEGQMGTSPQAAPPSGDGAVTVSEWLRPELVLADLQATSGGQVLDALVRACTESDHTLDGQGLLAALVRREQLCSTALGQGVAFPHVRDGNLRLSDRPVLALARVPAGVAFGAADGQPTYLFFMVYAPTTKLHLRILARLSQLVRDPAIVAELRRAADAQAIVRLLREAEANIARVQSTS